MALVGGEPGGVGEAPGHGDAVRAAIAREGLPLEGPPHAVRHAEGRAGVRLGEEHRKLLAAVAAGEIGAAHRGAEDLAEASNGGVAGGMAEGVVDLLEVVEVEEGDGDRRVVAAVPGPLLREPRLEIAPRGQSGELVRDRDLPVARSVERRGQRGEQRAQLRLAVRIDRLGRHEGEVGEQDVARVEGQVQTARRLGAGQEVHRRERTIGLDRGESEHRARIHVLADERGGRIPNGTSVVGRAGERPVLVDLVRRVDPVQVERVDGEDLGGRPIGVAQDLGGVRRLAEQVAPAIPRLEPARERTNAGAEAPGAHARRDRGGGEKEIHPEGNQRPRV